MNEKIAEAFDNALDERVAEAAIHAYRLDATIRAAGQSMEKYGLLEKFALEIVQPFVSVVFELMSRNMSARKMLAVLEQPGSMSAITAGVMDAVDDSHERWKRSKSEPPGITRSY